MELDYVRHKVVKMKLCTLSMQRFQVEFLYLEFRGAIGTHNNIIERRDTKLLQYLCFLILKKPYIAIIL